MPDAAVTLGVEPKPYQKEQSSICWMEDCSFGGLEGDRTLGLTDANRTLSQLSYEPIFHCNYYKPFAFKSKACAKQ